MGELDRILSKQRIISRDMVLAAGGTDEMISTRLRNGWWTAVQPGVYRIGPQEADWIERLRAGVLAAGDSAAVSHRSAYVLWGLDGISTRIVEITVAYDHAPDRHR